MLSYPVRLIPTPDKRVRALVLDVPKACSEGATEDEALANIKHSLELALGHRLHDKKPILAPSDLCGAPTVTTDKFILQLLEKATLGSGRS